MKRNKFFSKRRLASFVALVLSVNTLSVTAWAGSFSQLQEEIDKAQKGDGNVVLGEDYWYQQGADGNKTAINITGTVDLNLNGHTIQGSGKDSVIYVKPGASLTLRDKQGEESTTAPTENQTIPKDAGDETGTTEKVGTITGGAAQNGGGIHVGGNGKKAEFIMEGGMITGNTGNRPNSQWTGGAGVYVYNATFTMNGGKITENTGNWDAAGVELENAAFVMNGGEITNNTAAGQGGGISLKLNSSFEMNGGRITGNIGNNVPDDISQISKPNKPSNSTVTINAGTVTKDVQETYAPDAIWVTEVENKPDMPTIVTIHDDHKVVVVEGKAPTCTGSGWTEGKRCSVCGTVLVEREIDPATGHKAVADTERNKPATCGKPGWEGATKCSVCGDSQDAGKEIPATGNHIWAWDKGEVTKEASTEEEGVMTYPCANNCGATTTKPIPKTEPQSPVTPGEGDEEKPPVVDPNPEQPGGTPEEPAPDEPTPGEPETPDTPEEPTPDEPTPDEPTPETPDTPSETPVTPGDGDTVIPDDETPLAADPTAAPAAAADTTVITDDPIPLAGLITRAQLLAELYRYEQRPEVVLPEEFDFAEHEYALAICWGLENALETHSEDDPYLPDDLLTVGVLREVLVNFVAYKGIEDLEFTVEGEDDELVMDLDVRLAAFYELLEAEEA